MNVFTKKSLYVALAALGVSGAADAVNVSQDGLGQVLIYPYYTVNAGPLGNRYNTLLSVVNTTASAKVVKVRFREALNSAEVLDFNVFLSARDVWTASVTPDASGTGQVSTNDSSCTIPAFTANVPVPFRNTRYFGDGGGNSLTRTAEGYIEIFEMGDYVAGSAQAKAITHDQSKSPPRPTCAIDDTTATANLVPGSGGLMGAVALVNPTAGGAFTQNATALDNFGPGLGYSTTGSDSPNYTEAAPVSAQISGNVFYRSTWGSGEDAVSAVLASESVLNEFALDPGALAATNWIITHPTKYLYVNPGIRAPFTSSWDTKNGGACETVGITVWNREETSITTNDFSPAAGGTELCYEANVLGFSAVNLFGSQTFVAISTTFPNGWARVTFNNGQVNDPDTTTALSTNGGAQFTPVPAVRYWGLPVIGFAAETFTRSALVIGGQATFASFGSEMEHRRTVSVHP